MSSEFLSKEHHILSTIRKVLSAIARETVPPQGRPHPLTPKTIDDLKHCFTLISAREKEIIEAAGGSMDKRPRYADEPKKSHVVQFTKPEEKD